jgi:hypothetical protein
MSSPLEWRSTTTYPNAYDIERSAVITVLIPHLVENIVGKWLWDTFGETAFYEVCRKFTFLRFLVIRMDRQTDVTCVYRQIPTGAPVIGR